MTQPLPTFLFWLCGGSGFLLGIMSIPLWLRRVPPNRAFGARFPATLADPRIWYEINARAGRDLAVAGIAYGIAIVAIATIPGWNNPVALLAATAAWVAALITSTAQLGKAAARLRDNPPRE